MNRQKWEWLTLWTTRIEMHLDAEDAGWRTVKIPVRRFRGRGRERRGTRACVITFPSRRRRRRRHRRRHGDNRTPPALTPSPSENNAAYMQRSNRRRKHYILSYGWTCERKNDRITSGSLRSSVLIQLPTATKLWRMQRERTKSL